MLQMMVLLCRDEHGQDWIMAYFGQIRTGSDCNFFSKLADQDWIGLRKFLMFLCDYSEHIKIFSRDPIFQIC